MSAPMLLLLVPGVPLLLALLLALPGGGRRVGTALWPWAALPALLVALLPLEVEARGVAGLLLDTRIGLDQIGRVFLLFTALLWLVSGWYARTYLAADRAIGRYAVFHLLTLGGNLGLLVAHDLASFYLSFALMTFAGYGLVVHTGEAAAWRAGRIYIVLAVIGEVFLLAGLLLAGSTSPTLGLADVAASIGASPHRNAIVPLLLAGFGVKAGALPLHVWLPLAHPVAPTPASAVLSGSMIKAGLLGWLRFLPLGVSTLPGWGALLVGLGVAAAFFGVVLGVMQREAKTTLAYSSISQMGIINVAVGIGLGSAEAWPAALAACLAYAVHHGLAKGALFLGVGVIAASAGRARMVAMGGMALAALSIAGAPLTSGSAAKQFLKSVAPLSPAPWPGALDLLLPLAALGSTLLMSRVLWLSARPASEHHGGDDSVAGGASRVGAWPMGLWAPWLTLLAAVMVVTWWVPARYELEPGTTYGAPGESSIWVSVWPVVGGALAAWLGWHLWRRGLLDPQRAYVAPGDMLLPIERWVARLRMHSPAFQGPPSAAPMLSLSSKWYGVFAEREASGPLLQGELALTRFRVTGVMLVLVVLALIVAVLR